MFDFKNQKLYIHRRIGRNLYIGHIDQESATLFVQDKDNYEPISKSLGVDEAILIAPKLEFRYISIKWYNNKLITTRKYFFDHSIIRDLKNLREMRFMEIRLFDIDKALQYEKELIDNETAQLNIFDIGTTEAKGGARLINNFINNLSQTIQDTSNEEIKKERSRKIITF